MRCILFHSFLILIIRSELSSNVSFINLSHLRRKCFIECHFISKRESTNKIDNSNETREHKRQTNETKSKHHTTKINALIKTSKAMRNKHTKPLTTKTKLTIYSWSSWPNTSQTLKHKHENTNMRTQT